MGAKRWALAWLLALGIASGVNAQGMRIQFAEPVAIDARPGRAQFDAYGRRFEFTLESNDRLLNAMPSARKAQLSGARLMRGRLSGIAGSWVRIARVGDGVEGAIWDGTDLYAITTRARIDSSLTAPLMVGPTQAVVYRLSDALGGLDENFCAVEPARAASLTGTTPLEKYKTMVGELQSQAASAVTLTDQIEVSLIGDSVFQQLFGANATDEMLARLNIVDGIFSEQVGVLILATDVRVLSSANDPFTTADPQALLGQLANYRENTPEVRSRGLAHLITGRDLTENTTGIAYIASLCDPRLGSSLSDSSWGTLTAAQVMAHEFGHNFGARHDAEAGSVCAGTPPDFLMSPNVNGSGTFSACSLTSMAPVIAGARGRCVVAPSYADIRLEGPAGTITSYDLTPFDVPFVVTSAGNLPAQQTVFQATLPPFLSFQSASVAGGTCSANGNLVSCTLGTLAAAEARTVTISVIGSQLGGAVISATASMANEYLRGNNSASATLAIRSGVDVGVTLTASASTIYVGDEITYTIDVAAYGNRVNQGVVLDADFWMVDFESISAGANTCTMVSSVSIRCQIVDLAPGAHTAIVVRARGERGFDAQQRAGVTITNDGNWNNNYATLTTVIQEEFGISTRQTSADFSVIVGRSYTNTYTITGLGRLPTTDVRLHLDPLPNGTIESVTPSAGTCVNQGGTWPDPLYACSFGTLSPGDVRTVEVKFHANTVGYNTLGGRSIYWNGRQDITNYQSAGVRSAADMDMSVDVEVQGSPTESLQGTGAMRVRALGINASQNIGVTLDVPATVQLTALTGQGWTCTRPTAQQGRCTRASQSDENFIYFTFIASTPGPTQLHASVTSDGDSDPTNNSIDRIVDVLPYLDAAMLTTADQRQVVIRGTPKVINLTITTGARPVTNARVTAVHNRPAWEVASLEVSGVSCPAESFGFACDLASLPANASVPVTVRFNALTPAYSGGSPVCVSLLGDSRVDNNCVDFGINTFAMTELRLSVAEATVSGSNGTQFVLPRISVTNGADFGADVHVSVPLPSFTTFKSVAISSGHCTGTTVLDCDFQLVRPNEVATLDVTVLPTGTGTFTSNLQLTAANDSTAGDNAASFSVSVSAGSSSSSGGGSSSSGGGSSSSGGGSSSSGGGSSSSSGGGGGGGGRMEWLGLAILALLAALRSVGQHIRVADERHVRAIR